MSKNDMLAPIVRALVGVPQERLGVLFDVINKVGGADGELWRTRFAEVLHEGMLPSPKTSLDTLICVDRSIRPVYPNWAKTVMHPELELTGPTEYDLGTIDSWPRDIQKSGRSMEGHKLYEYLKKKEMLENCLSLRDGEEIQKKGLAVFRKFFKAEVFLWKSVVHDCCNGIYVPYLYEGDDQVKVYWVWLGEHRRDYSVPVLRFAS